MDGMNAEDGLILPGAGTTEGDWALCDQCRLVVVVVLLPPSLFSFNSYFLPYRYNSRRTRMILNKGNLCF